MTPELLAFIWFCLLGVLLIGYAVLDGFDLGVGILHPFVAKDDEERRIFMNSIGPLWDGNEVWLITFGGALFAMFPEAYSTIFSGLYNALMLVLFALILRAVSMEFRSKLHPGAWRNLWDWAFFLGSFLATLLFGVAVGNAMVGMPLDERHEFVGTFFGLLNPYSLLVGVFAVSMFAMHGSIYLYLKTESELQQRLKKWMWRTFFLFLVMFLVVTAYTMAAVPRATQNLMDYPFLWVIPLLNVLAIANIPRAIHKGMPGYAFISSCCTIAAFCFLFSTALFPNMVTSSPNPENTLTIWNSRSSELTLRIGLLIAVLGMPMVLSYTAVIYWTFRGKVQLGDHSY